MRRVRCFHHKMTRRNGPTGRYSEESSEIGPTDASVCKSARRWRAMLLHHGGPEPTRVSRARRGAGRVARAGVPAGPDAALDPARRSLSAGRCVGRSRRAQRAAVDAAAAARRWRGKINSTSQPVQPKTLTVLLDNGKGTTMTVDGSGQPNSIIDARVKPGDLPVRDIWPDGQERELTFIYSACGCPVKVFARRVGDRTMRVSDTPVIFPDDPAAVTTIAQLMKW